MLPAPHRLSATRDIERVAKTGKYASTPAMVVRVAKGGGVTRAAVVAGLKVHKSSVQRNLVKRRIREALREMIKEIVPGIDLVVVARSGSVGKSYADLGNELYGGLLRLGVIHKKAKSG